MSVTERKGGSKWDPEEEKKEHKGVAMKENRGT